MTPATGCSITPFDVLSILREIASTLHPDRGLNERYLHHAFSHRLQTLAPCLDLSQPRGTLLLHPEWPTFKDATSIAYAKYRDTTFPDGKDCYMPITEGSGSAGFIDFAIGPYDAPTIGVEFSLKTGWDDEEVVYDFLKVLDPRTPFTTTFSHNFIIRANNLAGGYRRDNLERHITGALEEAVHRLDTLGIAAHRDVYLIISEIAMHERRHWHHDGQRFIDGLPATITT